MWPFKKRPPLPEPVIRDGVSANYVPDVKAWFFSRDGIEFWVSGPTFKDAAFDWSKEAMASIRGVEAEMRRRVTAELAETLCDPTKAKISMVDLDEYSESKTLDVEFTGDGTWGDIGVSVILENGVIVAVHSGD
jgi:hypothetical protein